jgi:hypothetical protein
VIGSATPLVLARVVAQAQDTTTEWKQGAGNVMFLCLFVIGLIVAAIWWLRRG